MPPFVEASVLPNQSRRVREEPSYKYIRVEHNVQIKKYEYIEISHVVVNKNTDL